MSGAGKASAVVIGASGGIGGVFEAALVEGLKVADSGKQCDFGGEEVPF
jgi:hypothetical protein